MFEVILPAGLLVLGLAAGFLLQRRGSKRVLDQARSRAEQLREEAARAGELTQREHATQLREQQMQLEQLAVSEQQTYRQECQLIAERVRKLEARCERREDALKQRGEAFEARQAALRARKQDEGQHAQRLKELDQAGVRTLEQRAGQTVDELRSQWIEQLAAETEARAADRLRNLEQSLGAELSRMAKRVMGIAIQRYQGYCPRDRAPSVVQLQPGEAAKLSGDSAGNLSALAESSQAQLTLADEGDSIRIESGDGMTREFCRRAIARFISEAKVKDPVRLVAAIRRDLERETSDYGREAFKTLKLEQAAAEVSELVGRLHWRTSYTQNQYWHSIEAAVLAGLMAAELGLDVRLAARATLLHDIGKSLTHVAEGSHALIGAEVARASGEPDPVVNAIASHHGEEPMATPYALLATAADAMSGGRPGARREMMESYDTRIGDLEQIASSFKGVETVHAVQAGREIRIHVDERKVADPELPELCSAIARKISEDVVFPGQIRVTVIREFRAVSQAS